MSCSFKILSFVYLLILIPDLITLIHTYKGSKHEPYYVGSQSNKNNYLEDYTQLYDNITIPNNNTFIKNLEYHHKSKNLCHKIEMKKKNLRLLIQENSYINETWCKEIKNELENGKSLSDIFPIKENAIKKVHSMATGLLILLSFSGIGILIIASCQSIIFVGDILTLIIDLILFIILWINFNESGVRKYLDFLDCKDISNSYRYYDMAQLQHTEFLIISHTLLLIVRFIYTICYNVRLIKYLNYNNDGECFIAIILWVNESE